MSSQPATATLDASTSRRVSRLLANRWAIAVCGSMAGWALALGAVVRDAYVSFELPRYDLGNMVQAVWSTAHGHPLEVTEFWGDQVVRLGVHVDPILALLAPLWVVAPTPLTLLFVNVGALALGALPVFWLARRHLASDTAAGLLALAYLVYPWVGWSAVDAFHPVTLAVPLFLYCIWFLDTGRLGAFAICACLGLLLGELMGLSVAALGIWYALARGRRKEGVTIALLAAAWTVFAVYAVVPAFSDGSSVYYGYFGSIGGSPQGVVRTALTDPGAIASAVSTSRDLSYLVLLAAPLACIFVFSPGLAAVATPQVLVSVLSDSKAMTDPRHHYAAASIPFLVAATVLGIERLRAVSYVVAASVVLVLSLSFTLLFGAWPGLPGDVRTWDTVEVSRGHADALRSAVALVPDDAAVSATNKAGSHLSARRYFYSPLFLGRAEWIVLDTQDPFIADPGFPVLQKSPERLEAFRRRVERSPRWERVFEQDGVFVFRRTARDER
jgi:uncharacterized membrane protein